MAALVCEFCGGKLITKSGGICECDSCGMEFDKAWVKEKIQEIKGTVKVEGTVEVQGTVKVKGGTNVENFVKRANRALMQERWDEAEEFFEKALEIDPTCADAHLGMLLWSEDVTKVEDLISCTGDLRENDYYEDAVYYVDDALKRKLINAANERVYRYAKTFMEPASIEGALEAKPLFESIHDYKDSATYEKRCVEIIGKRKNLKLKRDLFAGRIIGAGTSLETRYTIGLRFDGKVVVSGGNWKGKLRGPASHIRDYIKEWNDVVAVCHIRRGLTSSDLLYLCSDGTVRNKLGNEKWHNICSIDGGDYHAVGLRSDGTVVATGDNDYGQCDVTDWRNIAAIAAGSGITVGLRSDGTVVATGDNDYDQCNVTDWHDIAAIAVGGDTTVGLRSDGTVVATGDNDYGQCDVTDWRDIVAIAVEGDYTVGLRSDGTVVATGDNDYGQCDVTDWCDIAAIAAGSGITVGLRSDGTVVATGDNDYGQCDVTDWRDIVAITVEDSYTVGLRSDGTVVGTGYNEMCAQSNMDTWHLYDEEEKRMAQKKIEQVRAKAAPNQKRAELLRECTELSVEQAKLQAELPTLKGLFSGGRRKQIEARLAQIPTRIAEIDSELARIEEELAALG